MRLEDLRQCGRDFSMPWLITPGWIRLCMVTGKYRFICIYKLSHLNVITIVYRVLNLKLIHKVICMCWMKWRINHIINIYCILLFVNRTCGTTPDNAWHIFRPADDPSYPWPGLVFGLTILATNAWCTDQVSKAIHERYNCSDRHGHLHLL